MRKNILFHLYWLLSALLLFFILIGNDVLVIIALIPLGVIMLNMLIRAVRYGS